VARDGIFYFLLGAAKCRADSHLQLTTQGKPAAFNGQLATSYLLFY